MNYFESKAVAERYARARPDLHPLFIPKLGHHIKNVGRALDVGCGTGMSSRCLGEVAGEIVGIDPAVAMLGAAKSHPRVAYCAAAAEALPFESGTFSLIGAGLAIHWFERERFLAEARRVLDHSGWVFISNTWFCGTMRDNPPFEAWMRTEYFTRYPSPPRNSRMLTKEEWVTAGLTWIDEWSIEEDVPMSASELAEYLSTQSNVTAAIERTGESLERTTEWLRRASEPFFQESRALFTFAGSALLLRRCNA